MRFSDRERRLARLVLLALLALAVTRFVWFPLLGERRQIQARLAEVELQRLSVQRNLAAREAVERNFAALQDQLQEARSNEEDLSLFLRSLSRMLSGMALRIGQVRALPSEVQRAYKKHTVQVEVTGHLASLARLLAEVSLSELPVRIERMEVVGAGNDGRVKATLWISELILLEMPPEGGAA